MKSMLLLLAACSTSDPNRPAEDTGSTDPVTSSSGPTSESSAAPSASWSGGVSDLVASRCAGCHAGEAPAGDLDLALDPLGAMLAQPAGQADMNLIEPGDHLYSYLWHKINGSQSIAGGSGTNMPIGAWLDDAEIELLAEWIDRECP
jgi:hypothetical protein